MSRLRPHSFSTSVSSRAHELLNLLHDHLGSGTLRPDLAHLLFDELLCQPVPVSERAINGLFAALARAPPSMACPDAPGLAIALFRRMARTRRCGMTISTNHTYSILIDCCCRARRPDLGPAFFGCLVKAGVTADIITFSNLFKCLCDMKQTDEALDVLLHRMPDDLPDVKSYSIILKSFCNNGRSQCALDLLRMMDKKGANHSPNVVAYSKDLCLLWSRIAPLSMRCAKQEQWTRQRMGRMDDAMDKFNEVNDMGVPHDTTVYTCMIEGYLKHGDPVKAKELIAEMKNKNIRHRSQKGN
ncbi:hypothetical protein ACQ4PT_056762 [Festuca glaucescens]